MSNKESKKSNRKTHPDDDRKAVFVKLNELRKAELSSSSKLHGITHGSLIESLIKYFNQCTFDEQQAIANGRPIPLSNTSDFFAITQDADHAFKVKNWVRAEELHQALLHAAKYTNATRFINWALYRLGFIWIELAYECRHAALDQLESADLNHLPSDFFVNYNLSVKALCKCLKYGRELNYGPHEPNRYIARINNCCAYSLLCQYKVEAYFLRKPADISDALVTEWVRKLTVDYRECKDNSSQAAINCFNHLSSRLNAFSPETKSNLVGIEFFKLINLVGKLSQQVSEELLQLGNDCSDESSKQILDLHQDLKNQHVTYLIKLLNKDNDLQFIKSVVSMEGKYKARVNDIMSNGLPKREWIIAKTQDVSLDDEDLFAN